MGAIVITIIMAITDDRILLVTCFMKRPHFLLMFFECFLL